MIMQNQFGTLDERSGMINLAYVATENFSFKRQVKIMITITYRGDDLSHS